MSLFTLFNRQNANRYGNVLIQSFRIKLNLIIMDPGGNSRLCERALSSVLNYEFIYDHHNFRFVCEREVESHNIICRCKPLTLSEEFIELQIIENRGKSIGDVIIDVCDVFLNFVLPVIETRDLLFDVGETANLIMGFLAYRRTSR